MLTVKRLGCQNGTRSMTLYSWKGGNILARILTHLVDAEIRLFEERCLFKGQSAQQGLQWLQILCVVF
jgi:hypothetical protein